MIPYFIRHPFRRHVYNPCVRFFRHRKLMEIFGVDRTKYACEIEFWQEKFDAENGEFDNAFYKRLFLAVAGEENQDFVKDKIFADFGCGPRGSLQWADQARLRIGIDVIADAYTRFNTRRHDMCYVTSTEKWIPLPSNYADVLSTINSIDHVDDFPALCSELRRVMAPGAIFLGSFNLDEPSARCEPQTLTEELLKTHLLRYMNVESYRIAPKGSGEGGPCKFLFEEQPVDTTATKFRVLWVRATLKSE